MRNPKQRPISPHFHALFHQNFAEQAALTVPRRVASHAIGVKIIVPQFPMEVVLRGVEQAPPSVLTEPGNSRVLCANAAAAGLGVRGGLPLKAATALSADIRVLHRDPGAESQVRANLAQWFHDAGYDAQFGDGVALEVWLSCGASRSFESLATRLRRDLRALGLRAYLTETVPLVTPLPVLHRERIQLGSPAMAAYFSSRLTLPWALARPRDLYTAVSRLLEEIRVIGEARRVPVRWVQWTFQHVTGTRDHHLFELDTPVRAIERLKLLARERLHRMPMANPLCALEIKAGF